METDIQKIATRANKVLRLSEAQLSEEFYYQSLPLCVLDAVFSINARYEGVRRVVSRYCNAFGLSKFRSTAQPPTQEDQETISSFCDRVVAHGPEAMAETVLKNRCRTSPRNGILKAAAALQFASVLRTHGIEYFQDIPAAIQDPKIEAAIRTIPGQRSGITFSYFWMLAGSDDSIKPDRMVLGFLMEALGRPVTVHEAASLVRGAVGVLRQTLPDLTPRLLDHKIWEFQREQLTLTQAGGCCA